MAALSSFRPFVRKLGFANGGVALFVIGIVMILILPLPTLLIDVLLSFNLALSVVLLLTALLARDSLELSTFPTLLVLTTLFRLALNVSSVRLILLQHDAGRVIDSFGHFVVRGNYLVGAALFLILTLVQYLVIARGAERIAEVGARFALDALPGAQLSIDADLRSGAIDQHGAKLRRQALGREARLFGALDGAMRFVKSDAIATLLILAISLLGGFAVGMFNYDWDAATSARVFGLLTIGDGLVTELPALLIATAAALVVTRAGAVEGDLALGSNLLHELARPKALWGGAALLLLLALVPGLPHLAFLFMSALAGAGAYGISRGGDVETTVQAAILPRLQPALELVCAADLLSDRWLLAEELEREARIFSNHSGVPLPLPVLSTAELSPGGYEIRVRGRAIFSGQLPARALLAQAAPSELPTGVTGDPAEHPTTLGLASWVAAGRQADLEARAIRFFTPTQYLVARFSSALAASAGDFLGLDETDRLIELAARVQPVLVREAVPRRIDLLRAHALLRALVQERVPIVRLHSVLVALCQIDPIPTQNELLCEVVRAQLQSELSSEFAPKGKLDALMLDGDAEEAVRGGLSSGSDGERLLLEPDLRTALTASVRTAMAATPHAVMVTSGELRRFVRQILRDEFPRLPVLAYHELLPDIEVERVGTISAA